ncbi:uncharacterized protein [Antedon mediterranea]|uniref:uncharacterized protein n=1 Tax=Antedon mediterranea TaxID=105859 RepID=UPI003AF8E8CD
MDGIYEVDSVLDVRVTKKGKKYLIQWKNYDHSNDSWEPEEYLTDCQEAIQTFYAKREKKKKKGKTELLKTVNKKTFNKKEKTITAVTAKSTETEIRPTPLTRRSVRLRKMSENVQTSMPQSEELSQMTSSKYHRGTSKVCSNTKTCPVKSFFYVFCLIMIFVIVFLSLPYKVSDEHQITFQK